MWNCYFSVNSRWLLVITDSLKGGTRMGNVFQNLAWNRHRRCVLPINADSEVKRNWGNCIFQIFYHLYPGLPQNRLVSLASLLLLSSVPTAVHSASLFDLGTGRSPPLPHTKYSFSSYTTSQWQNAEASSWASHGATFWGSHALDGEYYKGTVILWWCPWPPASWVYPGGK